LCGRKEGCGKLLSLFVLDMYALMSSFTFH
jgi:hypothetical protein